MREEPPSMMCCNRWSRKQIIGWIVLAVLVGIIVPVCIWAGVTTRRNRASSKHVVQQRNYYSLSLHNITRPLERAVLETFEEECESFYVSDCVVVSQRIIPEAPMILVLDLQVSTSTAGILLMDNKTIDVLILNLVLSDPFFASVTDASVVTAETMVGQGGSPVAVSEEPTGGSGGSPVAGQLPCPHDPKCGYIMNVLEPVFPPSTRALINIPGSCQNWAREWLRTETDVMEFPVDRIRQRYALALFYGKLKGLCPSHFLITIGNPPCQNGQSSTWAYNDNNLWLTDLHECDWMNNIGVDPCSRNGEYQIIRISGQELSGTLPPELSMLSSLREITLSDNYISGTIPSDFVKLSQLDTLDLSFNNFEGPIPDFVWQFEHMTKLELAFNWFTGTIPDYVHLTEPNLNVLSLENNDLSGAIPSHFGALNWQRLHLDGNEFSGPVPTYINSPNMEELRLHSNMLTGEFPAGSFVLDNAKKSKLREVTLYHNNYIKGNFEEMCILFYDGTLELLQVDDPSCSCCAGPP